MTDYTTLDLNSLLPGEPWTSGKALAVYENPIAIAEGAAGAPRLYGKAAVPRSQQAELPVLTVTAGSVNADALHYSGGFFTQTATSEGWLSSGAVTLVLLTGEISLVATQFAQAISLASMTGQIRLKKNDIVIDTFSIFTNETPVTTVRTINISAAVGDVFEWEVQVSSGSGTSRVSTQAVRASDAYTRIGIPIKVSDL
jgi:hypothetical protein